MKVISDRGFSVLRKAHITDVDRARAEPLELARLIEELNGQREVRIALPPARDPFIRSGTRNGSQSQPANGR